MNFFRRHTDLILLALIVILAGALRFYELDNLPPGMWFDEAWSAVAARDSAKTAVYPLYYAANFGGMHPAVVYLTRFANLFSNGNPLTIRYEMATIGARTIFMAYFAFHAIWQLDKTVVPQKNGGDKADTPRPFAFLHIKNAKSLFAAFVLAIIFPYLLFTRMGFESSLVTPASIMVFWALAVALRRGRWGYFVFTGALLGASLYVFDTARFLPFAVSAAYWGLAWRTKRPLKTAVFHFALMGLTAVFIFTPLAAYFLTNWAQFTARAGIVTANTLGADNVPLALWRNAWHTVAAISLPGYSDPIARHNLPGRPIFDLFMSLAFWLGAGVMAWRWKRPSSIIFISWAGVMLLPVILTDGAPTYTRIFGALPAFAAIAATGLDWLRGRDRRLSWLVLLLLMGSLGITAVDYFYRWANEPQLFDNYQVGDWLTGQLARKRLATDTVFLSPPLIDEGHPSLDLLLGETAVRQIEPACLVYQNNPAHPISYLTRDAGLLAALQQVYPTGEVVEQIIHPLTGEKLMELFVVEDTASSELVEERSGIVAQFGGTIGLLDGVEVVEVDDTLTITATWQALAPPTADHTLFIHISPAGEVDSPPLAQLDMQPCLPTSAWQTGDLIRDRYQLALPPLPSTSSGDGYAIALGWYTWPTYERLSLESEDSLSGDRYLLRGSGSGE